MIKTFFLILFVIALLIGVLIFANINFSVKYKVNEDYVGLSRLSIHPLAFNPIVPKLMNRLAFLWVPSKSTDPAVIRKDYSFIGYEKAQTKLSVFSPKDLENKTDVPCLVLYHGGGFMYRELPHYYTLVCEYAKQGYKVVFVHYRCDSQFQICFEDGYASLEWVNKNASLLGIDANKIAVGGDSAGGSIAAAVTHMSRDRDGPHICFQLLIFPYLAENISEKAAQNPYNPIINSRAVAYMREHVLTPDKLKYFSPTYLKNFDNLPDAYVEVEEFDVLREGGLAYAELLKNAGAKVQVEDVKGSFHWFDILTSKPLTKEMVRVRGEALKAAFGK